MRILKTLPFMMNCIWRHTRRPRIHEIFPFSFIRFVSLDFLFILAVVDDALVAVFIVSNADDDSLMRLTCFRIIFFLSFDFSSSSPWSVVLRSTPFVMYWIIPPNAGICFSICVHVSECALGFSCRQMAIFADDTERYDSVDEPMRVCETVDAESRCDESIIIFWYSPRFTAVSDLSTYRNDVSGGGGGVVACDAESVK